jgi:hypothetical protein
MHIVAFKRQKFGDIKTIEESLEGNGNTDATFNKEEPKARRVFCSWQLQEQQTNDVTQA